MAPSTIPGVPAAALRRAARTRHLKAVLAAAPSWVPETGRGEAGLRRRLQRKPLGVESMVPRMRKRESWSKRLFTGAKNVGVKSYFVEMSLDPMKASTHYLHTLMV